MNVTFAHAIGDRVRITEAKIDGTVDQMSIGLGEQRDCRVVYWDKCERKQVWLPENELEGHKP